MRELSLPTIGQSLEQEGCGKEGDHRPQENRQTYFPDSGLGQYGRVSEWVGDGNEAVKRHCQEHGGFDEGQDVDEVHLRQASVKPDPSHIKPAGAQGGGQSAQNQARSVTASMERKQHTRS